jgi:hypothetical protein
MKNGVEYVLRFGDLRMDTSTTSSEKTDAEQAADATAADKAKAGDKSVQRYLFAMARFNVAAVKKPELEPLPPLPDESADAATETPAATEAPATEAAAPATEAPATTAPTTEPTEEEEEEEETTETANSLQRAGESESASTADAKPADSPAADAKPAAPAPEKKHSPEYERILAERKRIETENQRKLDEYNALVEKGRQEVKDLNLRFGDWYFVVSNDTFQKVRLGKSDVVQKKGTAKPAAANQGSPAGLPSGGIPGFPSLPGAPPQQ